MYSKVHLYPIFQTRTPKNNLATLAESLTGASLTGQGQTSYVIDGVLHWHLQRPVCEHAGVWFFLFVFVSPKRNYFAMI